MRLPLIITLLLLRLSVAVAAVDDVLNAFDDRSIGSPLVGV